MKRDLPFLTTKCIEKLQGPIMVWDRPERSKQDCT